MKQIIPGDAYRGLPCSIVSMGCALGYTTLGEISALVAPGVHSDGYLSLKNMEALIKAHSAIDCKTYYKREKRPTLREFAHANEGRRAIICLLGHFVYFDGHDYHRFFKNGNDPVVQVWYLEDKT